MHAEIDEAGRSNETQIRVATLALLSRSGLLKLWTETFHDPPPPKLRKELIVPILAYRLQEVEFGGLSNTARKRLQVLITENRMKPSRPAELTIPERRSKLIRSWRGEVHEVIVTEEGFIYKGEAYQKLSPIAKRITGTQWSGPAFFGTKAKGRSA